MSWNNKKRYHM